MSVIKADIKLGTFEYGSIIAEPIIQLVYIGAFESVTYSEITQLTFPMLANDEEKVTIKKEEQKGLKYIDGWELLDFIGEYNKKGQLDSIEVINDTA